MKFTEEIQLLRDTIEEQVIHHPDVRGVMIGANRADVHSSAPACIRILVNKPNVKHSDLKVPLTIEGVPIDIEFQEILPW